MMERFIVYKHTCRTSGKSYIGQTKFTMEERWKGHIYDALHRGQCRIHKALRKYGIDNWDHEVLEVMTTLEGVLKAEQLWIKEYDTFKNGYNSTTGGEGLIGVKHSEESKQKIKEARALQVFTEEHRNKLRIAVYKRKTVFLGISKEQASINAKAGNAARKNKSLGGRKKGIPHSKEHSLAVAESATRNAHNRNISLGRNCRCKNCRTR